MVWESKSWAFRFIGAFKTKFASKMLRALVDAVSIVPVVSTSMEVGKDARAFNALFGTTLHGELNIEQRRPPLSANRVAP